MNSPIPAAHLNLMNWNQKNSLETRIKHGMPITFRTRAGNLVHLSWSQKFAEFRISNYSSHATAYTVKVAYRLVEQLDQMAEKEMSL